MKYLHTAYLVVICHNETNAIIGAEIWSSPEWMQSRRLIHRTYVAFEVKAESFQKAIDLMRETIANPLCRYHWLEEWVNKG